MKKWRSGNIGLILLTAGMLALSGCGQNPAVTIVVATPPATTPISEAAPTLPGTSEAENNEADSTVEAVGTDRPTVDTPALPDYEKDMDPATEIIEGEDGNLYIPGHHTKAEQVGPDGQIFWSEDEQMLFISSSYVTEVQKMADEEDQARLTELYRALCAIPLETDYYDLYLLPSMKDGYYVDGDRVLGFFRWDDTSFWIDAERSRLNIELDSGALLEVTHMDSHGRPVEYRTVNPRGNCVYPAHIHEGETCYTVQYKEPDSDKLDCIASYTCGYGTFTFDCSFTDEDMTAMTIHIPEGPRKGDWSFSGELRDDRWFERGSGNGLERYTEVIRGSDGYMSSAVSRDWFGETIEQTYFPGTEKEKSRKIISQNGNTYYREYTYYDRSPVTPAEERACFAAAWCIVGGEKRVAGSFEDTFSAAMEPYWGGGVVDTQTMLYYAKTRVLGTPNLESMLGYPGKQALEPIYGVLADRLGWRSIFSVE